MEQRSFLLKFDDLDKNNNNSYKKDTIRSANTTTPLWDLNSRRDYCEFQFVVGEKPETFEGEEEYYRPDIKEEPDDPETECDPSQAITGGSGMSRGELQTYNSIIDYERYKCMLCDIEVPIMYRSEHNHSQKHRINVEIIETFLKRLHNSILHDDTHCCVDKNLNMYFCGACAVIVKNDHKNDHESSGAHQKSVIYDRLLNDFNMILKNEDYLDTVDLKYVTKNHSEKVDITSRPPEMLNGVINNVKSTVDNALLPNEAVEDIKIDANVTAKTKEEVQSDLIYKMRRFIELLTVNTVEPTHKFTLIGLDRIQIKATDDSVMEVSYDNFNGFCASICKICLVFIEGSRDKHVVTSKHVERMRIPLKDRHCFRQIAGTYHHCVLCNENFFDMDRHMATAMHKEALLRASTITLPTTDTRTGLCGASLTPSNNSVTSSIDVAEQEINRTEKNHCLPCDRDIFNCNHHLLGKKHETSLNETLTTETKLNTVDTNSNTNQTHSIPAKYDTKAPGIDIHTDATKNHTTETNSTEAAAPGTDNIHTNETEDHTSKIKPHPTEIETHISRNKSNTREAKSNTDEADSDTAKTFSYTDESECNTADSITPKADSITVNADFVTAIADSAIVKADSFKAKADSETAQADSIKTKSKVVSDTAKIDSITPKAVFDTAKCVSSTTAKAEHITAKGDYNIIPEADSNTTNADSNVTNTDFNTAKADSDTTKAESQTNNADFNLVTADSTAPQIDSDTATAVSDDFNLPKADSGTAKSDSFTAKSNKVKTNMVKTESNTFENQSNNSENTTSMTLTKSMITETPYYYHLQSSKSGYAYCRVCETNFSKAHNKLNEHLNGGIHGIHFDGLLLKNGISKMLNNHLYCSYCKTNIEFQKELDHIASSLHKSNRADNRSNAVAAKGQQIETNTIKTKASKTETTVKIPYYHLQPLDATVVHCRVCKTDVSNHVKNIHSHLNGENHLDNFKSLLSNNNISDLHCGYCKMNIEYHKEFVHINSILHEMNKANAVEVKTTDGQSNSTKNMAIIVEAKSNTIETIDVKNETKPATENLHHHFQPLDKNNVYCRLCKHNVPYHINNKNDHLYGEKHINAFNELLSNNAILIMPNKHFYCQRCKMEIVFEEELEHIASMIHKSNTTGNKCNTAKAPSDTTKLDSNIVKIKPNTTKNGSNTVDIKASKNVKVTPNNIHYHFQLVNTNKLYCKVCKNNIPDNVYNMNDHLNGANHKKRVNVMFLENKITKSAKFLHCAYCKMNIKFEEELEHIASSMHKSNKCNTSEAKSDTAKAHSNTVKDNSKTAKNQFDAVKSNSDIVKAHSDTVKANSDTAKPHSDTVTPNSKTAKDQSDTVKSNSHTAKAQSDTVKANSDKAKAYCNTIKANSKTAKDQFETVTSNSGTFKVKSATVKANSKTAKAHSNTVKANSNTVKAQSDTVTTNSHSAKNQSDTVKVNSNTVKTQPDTVTANSKTAKANSDTVKARSDIVTANSDTGKPQSDIVTAKAQFYTLKVNSNAVKTKSHTTDTKTNLIETKDPTTEILLHHLQLSNNKTYCKVCKTYIPNDVKNISVHLNGRKHIILLKDLLSQNKLSRTDEEELFCGYCEMIVLQNEVDHVVSLTHKYNIAGKRLNASGTKSEPSITAKSKSDATDGVKATKISSKTETPSKLLTVIMDCAKSTAGYY